MDNHFIVLSFVMESPMFPIILYRVHSPGVMISCISLTARRKLLIDLNIYFNYNLKERCVSMGVPVIRPNMEYYTQLTINKTL